jgi:GNAT superfamily N-acetyltransferase
MIRRLLAVTDATWPASETAEAGGWLLRRGLGGGKRVSSASALEPGAAPDPAPAEAGMAAWGQPVLFRLGEDEAALGKALGRAGFGVRERVLFYAAPVAALADDADETARLVRVGADVAIMREIWAAGGICAARQAVMERVHLPAMRLLARVGDTPVGCAFVAIDGEVAMVHAMEVLASARRRGAGTRLLRGAANWAAERGAQTLALAVTEANAPARALYERLGMTAAARYHYLERQRGETRP